MGGDESKPQQAAQPVVVAEQPPAKPKLSPIISSKLIMKSQQKPSKLQKSNSVSTTHLAGAYKSTVRAEHASPSAAANLLASSRTRNHSQIRIKQQRKVGEQTITNPQQRNAAKQKQKVGEVSQVIEIDSPVVKKSGRKQSSPNRLSFKGKKPFDPKLSELIKLYGFN